MFTTMTGLAVVSAGISIINIKNSAELVSGRLGKLLSTSATHEIINKLLEEQIEGLIKDGVFTEEEIEELRQEALNN